MSARDKFHRAIEGIISQRKPVEKKLQSHRFLKEGEVIASGDEFDAEEPHELWIKVADQTIGRIVGKSIIRRKIRYQSESGVIYRYLDVGEILKRSDEMASVDETGHPTSFFRRLTFELRNQGGDKVGHDKLYRREFTWYDTQRKGQKV
jgi:hypothetical protein